MFKSKSVIAAVATAVVAGTLMLGGMAVTTTSGAGTDLPNVPGFDEGFGNWTLPTDNTGNPPASPVEPPANNPIGGSPATNPSGDAGAGTGAPGSLPNAGFGATDSGSNGSAVLVLVGLVGLALVGAGASAAASKRN
jgi:hypothetical protein